MESIPAMTAELGKYWEQPDRSEIVIIDSVAIMTEHTLKKLQRYDCSEPTAVYEGKMWVSRDYLGFFGESQHPNRCTIKYRKIVIVDDLADVGDPNAAVREYIP